MNPYLEDPTIFHTLHHCFATLAVGQLNPQILPKYIASTDTDIYIHEPPAQSRQLVGPDVPIVDRLGNGRNPSTPVGASRTSNLGLLDAPARARFPLEIDDVRIPSIRMSDLRTKRPGIRVNMKAESASSQNHR
jgi:hypothetical protein